MRPTATLLGISTLLIVAGCGHDDEWKHADLDRNQINLVLDEADETARHVASRLDVDDRVVSATGAVDRYADDGGDFRIVLAYPARSFMSWEEDHYVCYEFTSPDSYNTDFSETDCPDGLPDPQKAWSWTVQH